MDFLIIVAWFIPVFIFYFLPSNRYPPAKTQKVKSIPLNDSARKAI
jgi:hypothetical protein